MIFEIIPEDFGDIYNLIEENGVFYARKGPDTRQQTGVETHTTAYYGFADGGRYGRPSRDSVDADLINTVSTVDDFVAHVNSTGETMGAALWKESTIAFGVKEDGTLFSGYYGMATEFGFFQYVNGENIELATMENGWQTEGKDVFSPDEATYKLHENKENYVPTLTEFHRP